MRSRILVMVALLALMPFALAQTAGGLGKGRRSDNRDERPRISSKSQKTKRAKPRISVNGRRPIRTRRAGAIAGMGPLHPQNPYGAMSRRAKAFDYDRYGLSTEQRRRIASIRERYDRVIRRIDDDDRNRAAKIARLERKEREEIADVLNSEQRRRFLRELDRD